MTSSSEESAARAAATDFVPLSALVLGAFAMGASPVFVRLAEVGPMTSAFWRVALALPFLFLWAHLEARRLPPQAPLKDIFWPVALAGFFFAGDLTFWHLAVLHTSVANATFMATLAPVWVALGSGLFLGEEVGRRLVVGLLLCLVGGGFLVGESLSAQPEHLLGDFYGLVTSLFFGAYFLAVRKARRGAGGGRTLFLSSIVTAVFLGIDALALESQLWPTGLGGVAALFALAIVSHSGGQGLLAFALGHLPAAFSSLVIFLEGVAAAALGWLVLSESIGLFQAIGAAAIFAGIAIARPRHPKRVPAAL